MGAIGSALFEAAGPAIGESLGSLGASAGIGAASEAAAPAALDLAGLATGAGAGAGAGAVDLGGLAAAAGIGGIAGATDPTTLGLDRLGSIMPELGDATIPGAAQLTGATISPDTLTSLTGGQTPTLDVGQLTPTTPTTSVPPITPAGGVSAASAAAPAGVEGGIDMTSLLKAGKDWLGPAAAAGGLGYQVLKGQQDLPSTKAISQQASNIGQQASALSSTGSQYAGYLASGTLPPAMQAQVDQQTRDAKAAIISRYASMGMPTDPSKNSTLQQELASVDDKARQMTATLGQQLLQGGTGLLTTGANLTGMQDSLLTTLSGIDQTQSQQIGKAIANFASALGSMGKGNTVKTPAGSITISPTA